MANSLTDIFSALQNGVVALSNFARQMTGSFNNILGQLNTNAAAIAALQVLPYKVVLFTRDLTIASGNQSVTGAGFRPRYIQFQVGISGGNGWCSIGQSDGGSNTCIEFAINNPATGTLSTFYQGGISGIIRTDVAGGNNQTFFLATFDADGFTLTWTKNATPTGTASITATCFR